MHQSILLFSVYLDEIVHALLDGVLHDESLHASLNEVLGR